MTTDFAVFPDAEYLAVRILKDDATGVFSPFTPRIGTKLPADPDWVHGVVQVQRVGGVPTQRRWLDHPNIQVDVWAETKADAHDIAQRARVCLFRAEGKIIYKDVTRLAVITGVDDALGMHWEFDPLSLKPRYTFAVYFTDHP